MMLFAASRQPTVRPASTLIDASGGSFTAAVLSHPNVTFTAPGEATFSLTGADTAQAPLSTLAPSTNFHLRFNVVSLEAGHTYQAVVQDGITSIGFINVNGTGSHAGGFTTPGDASNVNVEFSGTGGTMIVTGFDIVQV